MIENILDITKLSRWGHVSSYILYKHGEYFFRSAFSTTDATGEKVQVDLDQRIHFDVDLIIDARKQRFNKNGPGFNVHVNVLDSEIVRVYVRRKGSSDVYKEGLDALQREWERAGFRKTHFHFRRDLLLSTIEIED